MKLTIEHLAAYLPYEVKGKCDYHEYKLMLVSYEKQDGFFEVQSDTLIAAHWGKYANIKLLLRPLSDLTKEIEHNGERFVPIERLSNDLKMSFEIWGYKCFKLNEIKVAEYTKLLSWHFDIFGLIPQGLAIPIKPIDLAKQYYTQTYHAFKGELIQDEIGNLIPKNHGK